MKLRRLILMGLGVLAATAGLIILCGPGWVEGQGTGPNGNLPHPARAPFIPGESHSNAGPLSRYLVFVSPPAEIPPTADAVMALSLFERAWEERAFRIRRRLESLRGVRLVDASEETPWVLRIYAEPQAAALASRLPGVEKVTPYEPFAPKAAEVETEGRLFALSAIRPAQAPATFTVGIHLNEWRIMGETDIPTPVLITVTNSRGDVAATEKVIPMQYAPGRYIYWTDFGSYWHARYIVVPENLVSVSQGSRFISTVIPFVTALADGRNDTISGSALPSQTVEIYLYREDDTTFAATYTATADASGGYTLALPLDLRGVHYGYVKVGERPDVSFYRDFVVPYLSLWMGHFMVAGKTEPNDFVSLWVRSAEGAQGYAEHCWSSPSGYFDCVVYGDYSWPLWNFQYGDVITLTAGQRVVTFTVPELTARFHRDSATVEGEGPPLSTLEVGVDKVDGSTAVFTVPVSAEGTYSLSLAAIPLYGGDLGFVRYRSPEDNVVMRGFAVPMVEVALNDLDIEGAVSEGGSPLTLTIFGPGGVKGLFFRTANHRGNFYVQEYQYSEPQSDIRVQGGDRVEVEVGGRREVSFTIPDMTLKVDVLSRLAFGEAPPGAHLRVWWGAYSREVTATTSGVYTADFSSLVEDDLGYNPIRAVYFDEEGNTAHLSTWASYLKAEIGGYYAETYVPTYRGHSANLLVLDEDGNPIERRGFFGGKHTITSHRIDPGYTLVLEIGEQSVLTVPVPTLTAFADAEADRIYGYGPPSSTLEIQIYDRHSYIQKLSEDVTTTATGAFSLDLSAQLDIKPGYWGKVCYSPSRYAHLYRLFGVPNISVELSKRDYSVLPDRRGPVTVTLFDRYGRVKSPPGRIEHRYFGFTADGWFQKPVAAGDIVVVTATHEAFSLTVPLITVVMDKERELVRGAAPAGAELSLMLCSRGPYGRGLDCVFRSATASAEGIYSATMPSDATEARVSYLTGRGDIVGVQGFAPHLNVNLDYSTVWGSSFQLAEPITLTLYARDGGLKARMNITSSEYEASFNVLSLGVAIEPSDVLEMQTPAGVYSLTIPVLTAQADAVSDIIRGKAPPLSFLEIYLWKGIYSPVSARTVRSDAQGDYASDWSDLDLRLGYEGNIIWHNERGDSVSLTFVVEGRRFYLPLLFKS